MGKKDDLIKLLVKVPDAAKKAKALGDRISESAQSAEDFARSQLVILTRVDEDAIPSEKWDRAIYGWQGWYGAAEKLDGARPHADAFVVNSFSTESSSSVTITCAMALDPSFLEAPEFQREKQLYLSVLERHRLIEKARGSLARLRLHAPRKGYRNATELLAEAEAALKNPAVEGAAASILIPLRGCIDAAIAELIRRRPNMESAKNEREKIESLAAQCARPLLSADHFKRLGDDLYDLLDDLSSAKNAKMSRDQVIDVYYRALLWFNAFLESYDETRFKPA